MIDGDWWEGPMWGFDTETTGVDPYDARVVTATLVLTLPDGAVAEHHEWLLDPGIPIPEGAAAVHGITTERAQAEGVEARQGIASILEALERVTDNQEPLVIYNAAYDVTVMRSECRRHEFLPWTPGPLADPLVLDKHLDPYRRGKRTLTVAAAHYGAHLSEEDAHTSIGDALAAVEVARAMGRRAPFPDLRTLWRGQVRWRAEQSASLQEYFTRQGKDEHVEPGWPWWPDRDDEE